MVKKLLIALGLLVIFITVCFLWKEKIDISQPINHEKFNAYFSTLGALLTAFSIFLIYQQVTLAAEANRFAYAPNIIVVCDDTTVRFHLKEENGKQVYTFHPSSQLQPFTFRVVLKNCGRSDATNVWLKCHSSTLSLFRSKPEVIKLIIGTTEILVATILHNGVYHRDWKEFFLFVMNQEKLFKRLHHPDLSMLKGIKFQLQYSDSYHNIYKREVRMGGLRKKEVNGVSMSFYFSDETPSLLS